ncbi:MAG: fused MFS/spermidine synthase [bacterium]
MNSIIRKCYLYLTLVITGAAVMIIEFTGTRVVAPIYGSGLFVWSSLITVTLTCLAIGYFIGGKIADKNPSFTLFYLIIALSGILIAPIPQFSKPILKWSLNFGFRIGPLVSAYIIFGIPMILLGMVSPYAIRLSTSEIRVLGATAGKLYAISTVGSFLGAILTGFILIPNFGSKKILFMQSVILVLLWVGHNIISKKYSLGLFSMAILCIPVVFIFRQFFPGSKTKNMKLLYKTESFYGQLKVIEEQDKRSLYFDNTNQSSIHTHTYLPVNSYIYFFEFLPLYNPHAENALLIGLAGANIPRLLWEYDIKTDCVDIEPKMEYISKKYFGFLDDFGKIIIADGRAYINKIKDTKKYDFVILDVFTGDAMPFHLLTKECFEEVNNVLSNNGILGINFVGEVYGENSICWKSVYKTLHKVFPDVKVFSEGKDCLAKENAQNIIFFASNSNLSLPEKVQLFCKGAISQKIVSILSKCELNTNSNQGIILTDDYSPIEFFRRNISSKLRKEKGYLTLEEKFL